MRRLIFMTCFALVAAPSHAQISAKELTLAGVGDCIKDAISAGSMENNGPVIILSCSAAKARTLYNFLGRTVRAEIVQDSNGKFENRPFGNNACYHRIEDPGGKTADDFRCDLLLSIGDVLNDKGADAGTCPRPLRLASISLNFSALYFTASRPRFEMLRSSRCEFSWTDARMGSPAGFAAFPSTT